MKFYISLILSAALHVAAVFFISDKFTPIKPINRYQATLFVSIKPYIPDIPETLTSKSKVKPQNKASTQITPLTDYLSEKEVEIKALPTNNIDETKLDGIFLSGLPIKMRLYINDAGHVVKIDKLDVLAQDRPAQDAIEKILLEMPFLPAKKSGVSVNSYQEIAFEFR